MSPPRAPACVSAVSFALFDTLVDADLPEDPPATVGDDCRLHGNIRAESLDVGTDNTIFGSLRARGDVVVGPDTEIKGDVTTRGGDVSVAKGATVWGDISAEDVELHEHAVVEGKIRVSGELTQVRDALGPEPSNDASEGEPVDSEADADTVESDDESTDDEVESDATDEGETASTGDAATDDGGDPEEEADSEDPPAVESRDAVESELDGVVPMMGSDTDHSENGHDDDAEIAPDAD